MTLNRKNLLALFTSVSPITGLLFPIILLSAGLHFHNWQALGTGNPYYTAAIQSMLASGKNFFFVAAEPGGSVSVDKPPLGLWLEALSACFLGVNGFAVTLPQMVAGVIAVPVLYHLVKKYFGVGAGLLAALVLAVTPITIAVDRDNTIDSTLILTLLLAAWAFINATDTGQRRYLLLGASLVGLGFNIKMMQAFLPLPAFYALYFFGAAPGWRRKVCDLILASVLLAGVSVAWVMWVDLTPPDQRPYVGSSQNNSMLELALGYNGAARLLGGSMMAAPNSQTYPSAMSPNFPPGGMANLFQFDAGVPGPLRLFTAPLVTNIGWLLPVALSALGLAAGKERLRFPLSVERKGAVLWGGWLLAGAVFFSAAGFMHAYYLAMLGPAVAAMVAIGLHRLWRGLQTRSRFAYLSLVSISVSTLVFQVTTVQQYLDGARWLPLACAALGIGLGFLALSGWRRKPVWAKAGFSCVVSAMLLTPSAWSVLTNLNTVKGLPSAYAGPAKEKDMNGFLKLMGMAEEISPALLNYLQTHTQDTDYLLAVPEASTGAPYVLATKRPVLYLGGFAGMDNVVTTSQLAEMVEAGRLRYVLDTGLLALLKPELKQWLQTACNPVTAVELSAQKPDPALLASLPQPELYECGRSVSRHLTSGP